MPPFFSIIIPSLNQPRFLEQCLKSVLAQTGPSWELIVIDGDSNREVLDIFESYREHFAHFESEPDNGQSDAVNKGFSLAQGRLVSWLNCDDFYEPGALLAMMEAFDREPDRPFYAGSGFRTDAEGKKREPFYPKGFRFSEEILRYGENEILQPATFIHRETLHSIGNRLDPELHYALDTDLWLRLSQHGDPLFIDKPIATLREYEGTKSAQGGWPRFEEIRRLAEKYTGSTLTPGALHVLAGTLCKELTDPKVSEQVSPMLAEKAIELWEQTGHSLKMLDGYGEDFLEASPQGRLEADKREPNQEIDRLRKYIAILEEDRRERGKQIERLTEVLVQSEKQRIDLTRDIEKLNQLIREIEEDRRERGEDSREHMRQSHEENRERLRQIDELYRLLDESEKDRAARLENNDKLTQLIHQLEADKQDQLSKWRREITHLRLPWWKKVVGKSGGRDSLVEE